MTEVNYAVVRADTGIVENVVVWDGVSEWLPPDGCFAVVNGDGAGIGWSYVDGVFIPPEPTPPTAEELEFANISLLRANNQLATAQKSALTNRVDTLQDAIELEMATPEEVAELPERQAQLLEWKRYAVYLGRVTQQEGWALTVEWPEQPADGMDLSTSARA